MARKTGRARKAPAQRDPFAYQMAVRSGSATGRHNQGRKRPKGKGTRSQKCNRAIREHC